MKPRFWEWLSHLAEKVPGSDEWKWQAPRYVVVNGKRHRVDYFKVVGFAVVMSTFGPEGGNLFMSAETLAERGNTTRQTAHALRELCVALGLFTVIGKHGRSVVYEIAIPPATAGEVEVPPEVLAEVQNIDDPQFETVLQPEPEPEPQSQAQQYSVPHEFRTDPDDPWTLEGGLCSDCGHGRDDDIHKVDVKPA